MKRNSKGNVSTPAKRSRSSYSKSRRYFNKAIPRTRLSTGLGFPKQLTITHKYQEHFIPLTSTSGSLDVYKWSCNGMYDPNITGTGHQPMYFDSLANLYDHYCVISSTLKARFVTPGSALAKSLYIGINVNDNTAVGASNANTLGEATQTVTSTLSQGATDAVILYSKWNAKAYFGGSILANTELQGTNSANPAEQSYFFVYCQSVDGVTTSACFLDIEIQYTAVWKELIDITSS